MRPPFAYYGGKAGLGRRIANLLPQHRVYIEPFLGSGAVLFAKRPATHEIANDLDGNVVTFFRVLRERPDELEAICRLTPYARDEWNAADLDGPLDDLERARRFWVRVNQSFGKHSGQQTGWSVTTARTQSSATSVLSRLDRFAVVARRLAAVASRSRRSTYLAATRRSRERRRPADYGVDMGEETDHERLAAALKATPAAVVLSGYHSPLYDRLYGDWWRLEIPVTVHSSNATTTTRDARVEVLWSNRDLDEGRLAFEEAAQ